MNKLVAIEGLDGSGKSTQIKLLTNYFVSKKIKSKYLHFPRMDSPVYGEMIASFLRGEFGDVNSVNPYLVALLYAGDRENAKPIIKSWLSRNYLVIVDRYVYSNIAFQCAKVDTPEEKERLREWIIKLEYVHNNIPAPSASIFLHMPFEFIIGNLVSKRRGSDRAYLNSKKDIHESSIELQKRVESEYLKLLNRVDNFYLVNCGSADNKILSPEKINSEIISILLSKHIIE